MSEIEPSRLESAITKEKETLDELKGIFERENLSNQTDEIHKIQNIDHYHGIIQSLRSNVENQKKYIHITRTKVQVEILNEMAINRVSTDNEQSKNRITSLLEYIQRKRSEITESQTQSVSGEKKREELLQFLDYLYGDSPLNRDTIIQQKTSGDKHKSFEDFLQNNERKSDLYDYYIILLDVFKEFDIVNQHDFIKDFLADKILEIETLKRIEEKVPQLTRERGQSSDDSIEDAPLHQRVSLDKMNTGQAIRQASQPSNDKKPPPHMMNELLDSYILYNNMDDTSTLSNKQQKLKQILSEKEQELQARERYLKERYRLIEQKRDELKNFSCENKQQIKAIQVQVNNELLQYLEDELNTFQQNRVLKEREIEGALDYLFFIFTQEYDSYFSDLNVNSSFKIGSSEDMGDVQNKTPKDMEYNNQQGRGREDKEDKEEKEDKEDKEDKEAKLKEQNNLMYKWQKWNVKGYYHFMKEVRYLLKSYSQYYTHLIAHRIFKELQYLERWKNEESLSDTNKNQMMDIRKYMKDIPQEAIAFIKSFQEQFHEQFMNRTKKTHAFISLLDKNAIMQSKNALMKDFSEVHLEIATLFQNPVSWKTIINNDKFILMIVFKTLCIFGLFVGIYFAEFVMKRKYFEKLYRQHSDPPSLFEYLGIMYIIYSGIFMAICILTTLLIFLFRNSYYSLYFNSFLIYSFITDFFLSLSVHAVFMFIVAHIMSTKRFFMYRYDGLRTINAISKIAIGSGILLTMFPYFLFFWFIRRDTLATVIRVVITFLILGVGIGGSVGFFFLK